MKKQKQSMLDSFRPRIFIINQGCAFVLEDNRLGWFLVFNAGTVRQNYKTNKIRLFLVVKSLGHNSLQFRHRKILEMYKIAEFFFIRRIEKKAEVDKKL